MIVNLIRLRDGKFNVLKISKSLKKLSIKAEVSFEELNEVKKYIKNRRNLYFSLFGTKTIKTNIDIPKVIKSDSTIKFMIDAKLKKEFHLDKNKIIYNYYENETTKNSTRYEIIGVYESDYKDFYSIATPKSIKCVTLDIYALYSINRYFFKDKSFISLYSNLNEIIIIAGNFESILFSRVINLKEKTLDFETLKDEAIKNILYIKQQLRVNFDLVTINGEFTDNIELLTIIENNSKVEVLKLMPKLIFKNIDFESFNRYLIEFGSLLIDDDLNFIPIKFKSKQQFLQLLNIYIFALVLLSTLVGYEIFNKANRYFDLEDNYSNLKSKLLRDFSKINIGSPKDERFISNFLKLIKNNSNTNLLNSINLISQKINTLEIEFENFKWSEKDNILSLEFEKKFEDLIDLNKFLKDFKKVTLDMGKKIRVDMTHDYKELSIKASFTLNGRFK